MTITIIRKKLIGGHFSLAAPCESWGELPGELAGYEIYTQGSLDIYVYFGVKNVEGRSFRPLYGNMVETTF